VAWLRYRLFAHPAPLATEASFTSTGSFGRALLPIVVSGAAVSAVPVVEKLLALPLGPGSASHLEYATRVLVIPAVLFDGAIAPHFLSAWSQLRARDGRPPTRHEVAAALRTAFAVAALVAVAIAGLAPEIVRLLLHHGKFTGEDAAAVVGLLRLMSLAFVGNMCALVVERAYFAAERNTLLATVAISRAVIRLLAIVLLLGGVGLGIRAFPIAYATAEWAYLLLLWVFNRGSPRLLDDQRA
jgi:peptidoglycan biosynthesis protein MviN/MurJ (putative lipid II flippase)